jgi:hypothetical protein
MARRLVSTTLTKSGAQVRTIGVPRDSDPRLAGLMLRERDRHLERLASAGFTLEWTTRERSEDPEFSTIVDTLRAPGHS